MLKESLPSRMGKIQANLGLKSSLKPFEVLGQIIKNSTLIMKDLYLRFIVNHEYASYLRSQSTPKTEFMD